MNSVIESTIKEPGLIHPGTRIGMVHLSVADLERQLKFYQEILGFKLHWREGDSAGLGAGGQDLLQLTEVRGARRARNATGLYHFAVLFPNRRELAQAIARLFNLRYPNHPTDHILTKTTYLDDPEGQTIELYCESPEDGIFGFVNGQFVARRSDGAPSDGREPLDVEALFKQLTPEDRFDEPLPPETKIGHVHLYVANLEESMRFYHEVLGFDNMGIASQFRMGMVSAGGYHHHVGFNTWVGEGALPPPPDSLGLRYFTVVLPDKTGLERVHERIRAAGLTTAPAAGGFLVRDPSQNGLVLTAGNNGGG